MAEEIMQGRGRGELDRKIMAVVLYGDERSFSVVETWVVSRTCRKTAMTITVPAITSANRLLTGFELHQAGDNRSGGYCLGGGFEMAMMGDFIVASEAPALGCRKESTA